ncbi:MAG: hypothetical protein M3067_13470, partial [Chloroflexota bacterium]|nr:hypothetical protein [Chloroflexota bacterium]
MTIRSIARFRRRPASRGAARDARRYAPLDPRVAVIGPLDPDLERIRSALVLHRRRLWLRRIARRGWIAAAALAVGELLLWTVARFLPLEAAPAVGVTLPVGAVVALLVVAIVARPSLGETALAVDSEARIGDRVTSALALAGAVPSAAGPLPEGETMDDAPALDEAAEERRFVRRQRGDALRVLKIVPPNLFRPRLSRNPALVVLVAGLVLAPVLLLPNPQDAKIAAARQARQESARQADRIDEVAKELEAKGADANDPRTKLAKELRDLARQLRERPADLQLNLARLGSVEGDLRAQLDPATEQRAASLTSVSRALSRAATGRPSANQDGDPKQAAQDLDKLKKQLDSMTPDQLKELAKKLSELQSAASQADGAAGQALRDAAQSLGQGDPAGAKAALDRLGQTLQAAAGKVGVNRDLASAASQLQNARRDLANAANPGQGNQPGQSSNPGQGQGQGQPGQSGNPGQGQGQGQPGRSGNPG